MPRGRRRKRSTASCSSRRSGSGGRSAGWSARSPKRESGWRCSTSRRRSCAAASAWPRSAASRPRWLRAHRPSRAAAPPRAHVGRGPQAHLRDDEEALARSEEEEQEPVVAATGSSVGYQGMPRPRPRSVARSIGQVRGRDVFDRHPQRLEQRDLAGRLSPGDRARRQLSQLARDVRRIDRAFANRQHQIARFGERARPRVDEHARALDERRVHLALIRAGRRRPRRCACRRRSIRCCSTGSRAAVASTTRSAPSTASCAVATAEMGAAISRCISSANSRRLACARAPDPARLAARARG